MEIKKSKREIVKKLLNQELQEQEEEEIIELLLNSSITIDVDKEEEQNLKFRDKVADKMSELFGSWKFILGFAFFIIIWISLNTYLLTKYGKTMDPYPFILLNLFLSCVAALQAPIIMMSQNRQSKKDSLRNKNDYQIDLKSEFILELLYEHIEKIEKTQKRILTVLKDPEQEIKLYDQDEVEEIVQKKVEKEIKKIEKGINFDN